VSKRGPVDCAFEMVVRQTNKANIENTFFIFINFKR